MNGLAIGGGVLAGLEVLGKVNIAVFVRRRGALPEVVKDIGAGMVFETADELIAAVCRLAADPALRKDLGERARAGARREGSEQRHVQRYLELVASCAERRGVATARS